MKNCTYVLRALLCLCLFVTASVLPGYSQLVPKSINVSNGDALGFLEYKPDDYDQKTTTKYPIIIFLHGIGERGNGTTELKNVGCCGLPRIIKLGHKMRFTWNGKTETFLVLAPQCPKKYGMWPQVFVDELIQYAKSNLRIDTNRIFLTGLSMGGGGTFRYISTSAEYPKKIAAAATICAPCTFVNGKYAADAKLPLWSFHAADDKVAKATCTEGAVSKLIAANAEVLPLKTIWPTGGHVVWDRVYTDTSYKYQGILNIYEWFLGQNKSLPVNKLPVARAGNTLETTTGTGIVTLDASGSTDADGKLVRFVWKKISGPSAGAITNAFGPNSSTTVTGLTIAGTYQYQLAVVDNRAAFTLDTVTVTVTTGGLITNKPPVARAGNDITITLPVNSVTLNGTASTDEDGTIKTYLWSKVSGPAVTIASPAAATTVLNDLVEGVYSIKLKVTDDKGASTEDLVTITVKAAPPAPNVLPEAKAGNDIDITLPVNKTTLDGSGSTDADGTISTYAWTKLSGPAQYILSAPNAATTALSNLVEGTYVFRLHVTDNKGGADNDTIAVTVNAAPPPPNTAPVAQAGANKTITLPVNTVTLNGDASADADGTITGYTWSYISGPAGYTITASDAVSTTVTGLTAGTYSFRLLVKDNDGATDADTMIVYVNEEIVPPPPPNIAPVAKVAQKDIVITLPTDQVTLDGSLSSDPDGTIASFAWGKYSGPLQYKIVNPASAVTVVENLIEGVYYFRLQVKDENGALDRDTIKVTVKAAPNAGPVANAGSDIDVQLPDPAILLDGSESSDADGVIESYSWVKVSGPAGLTITNSTTPTPSVVGIAEGVYVFRLTITDDKGAESSDEVQVTVRPAPVVNVAPVAVAGSDITLSYPETTGQLNAGGSKDDDGNIVSYSWELVSGAPSASIASPGAAITDISNLETGEYVFEVTVTDNNGLTSTDRVNVSVVNNLKYEQVLRVYPNPAQSTLNLQMNSDTTGQIKITVFNVNGISVQSYSAVKSQSIYQQTLNISRLQAGMYYLEVIVAGELRTITKFVKR